MKKNYLLIFIIFLSFKVIQSQNLVVDGSISNKTNWNNQEAPWNAGTFESTYLTGGCNTNYIMEVDAGSSPQQTVNGFISSKQYVLTFRCAYRNSGCGPSNNPTILQIQFTDAVGVLTYTVAIPNTQTTLTSKSYTFTNNASASHVLKFTNPGNANTCGAIVDDISINLLSSPGGASSNNLAFWLNPSSINQADNTSINCWISQGINTIPLTPPCATRPVYKTGQASLANALIANYNPYLTFNGSNQYLQYISSRIDLYDNSAGGEGDSYFAIYQGGSNTKTYFGHRGSNDSRTWSRTNRYIFPNGGGSGTNNRVSPTQSTRVNLLSTAGKSSGLVLSDLNGSALGTSNSSGDIDYLTVGVRRNGAGAYSEYYDNSLSEIIVFNTILPFNEMQQVRSYLASKYGVTLTDNTATAGIDERDYIATDGTNYWDYTLNSAYHNNVTVIGRDDATQLNQLKSISTDADGGSNTGDGMLIINNAAAISSDKSYFSTGHNGIAISTGADFVDVPPGIQSRLQRFWKFQKTGTGIANSITVQFDLTGVSPIVASDLRLIVSNVPSFVGATIYAGAYAAPYFTASLPTTGGVYYTVASINSTTTPLPIELIDFTATPTENSVILNWVTVTEINNKFFTVFKSADAENFSELGQVNGQGNSNVQNNYQIIDENPLSGTSYYKLQQTDFNGTHKDHNIVSVTFEKKNGNTMFSLFPNPNSGNFTLDFSGIENNHEVAVVIRDEKGSEVYNNIFYSQSINHNLVKLELKNRLSAGIYYCTFSSEGISSTVKVIVN